MVPALTTGGRSFKGAAAYYLHDKRQPGEKARDTADRVAWTETLNLPTQDADQAWRMMAHTAMAQAELKQAAGMKRTGRKLDRPVLAYSLAWHPDEQPDRAAQLEAARETLKTLGLERHQAVIVAHRDTKHAHIHVLVNRVDPDTGIAAKLSRSKLKLSKWAQAYELRHGRVFCAARVENNARRTLQAPGRAADNRRRRVSRKEWMAGGQDRAATTERRRQNADRFSDQAGMERAAQRRRQDDRAALYGERRMQRQALRDRDKAARDASRNPRQARANERMAAALVKATPALSLAEITRTRSTFTRAELVRLVGRHTTTPGQFKAVLDRLESSPDLVRLGRDERGRERFTTQDQQAIEQRMERHARLLNSLKDRSDTAAKWTGPPLSADQSKALRHVLTASKLSAVIGYAGSGKSTMLNAARASWEAAGYRVQGATLSGIAADGLKNGAGIDSRTIHSRLFQWEQGQNKLTAKDVLVIDEAGMIGSRQMERLLSHALEAKAKVVLVGDAQQLQAIEAGAAFRAIVDRVGAAEMTSVRRQTQAWQQHATRELATGRTGDALKRYDEAGMVHAHADTATAKEAAIDAWHKGRQDKPGQSQIILAFTRKDVRGLNDLARDRLKTGGQLGDDHTLATASGKLAFAAHDRLYFLKNDRTLGVKNGSLGTVESIHGNTLTVRLDGQDDKRVTFSTDDYSHIDHGYAATIHKSQGVTVDRAHLLATRNLDRHAAYVAMTRHRDRVDIHYGQDSITSRAQLDRVLSREGAKDTTLDYVADIDARQDARHQAAEDMKARIKRRAEAFAAREATPAGRMANARSLLGKDASMIEVTRLALNTRARDVAFRQQQTKLRQWARKVAPDSGKSAAVKEGQGTATDIKAALTAHDRDTERLAEDMHKQHAVQQDNEQSSRRTLTARAAVGWQQEIQQAQQEAGTERARESEGQEREQGRRVELGRSLSGEFGSGALKAPGRNGPG